MHTCLFALLLSVFLGQNSTQTADYKAKASSVIGQLAAGQYDRVEAAFDPTLAKELPQAKLSEGWQKQITQAGAFERITATDVREHAGGYRAVAMTCRFARASEDDALVVFNANGLIAGLYFGPDPVEEAPGWTAPAYARPNSFHEIAVSVSDGVWHLPGKITVPNGKGPFPAAVLIPGSPPLDEDATVGPNKIFKDLAWGLASRGIAVLRYTKRTHQEGAGLGGGSASFNVNDEVNDDARAAVALLATRSEIDQRRVFLIGHSLGGISAVQIAANLPVAGVAVMGTPAPDVVTALSQRFEAMGAAGQPELKTLAKIRNGELAPGDIVTLFGQTFLAEYWLDLRSFSAAAAAAKLNMPLLVMVAGHDAEVPSEDFDSWSNALAGRPNVTVKSYPNLFHLFMPSTATGKGDAPEDWGRPGHVTPEVVNELASWVFAVESK